MNKLFFVLIILYPSTSYAYLDPGTGSILLQAILGAIAAGFMTINIWWQKFKTFFSKILNFNKKKINK
tara:strand:- start:3545 stop:3748 length:204 start_codon:yes stop_codon:yes gene_type:complete